MLPDAGEIVRGLTVRLTVLLRLLRLLLQTLMPTAQARLSPDVLLFVLGDTSYGSCCVDEVAAEVRNCCRCGWRRGAH